MREPGFIADIFSTRASHQWGRLCGPCRPLQAAHGEFIWLLFHLFSFTLSLLSGCETPFPPGLNNGALWLCYFSVPYHEMAWNSIVAAGVTGEIGSVPSSLICSSALLRSLQIWKKPVPLSYLVYCTQSGVLVYLPTTVCLYLCPLALFQCRCHVYSRSSSLAPIASSLPIVMRTCHLRYAQLRLMTLTWTPFS